MKKTLSMAVASALSCALLLTGCSADKTDSANSAGGAHSTASTSTTKSIELSESQTRAAVSALMAGYRGEEAAKIAADLYKPGSYERYVAVAESKSRWDDIDKADKIKVGLLYAISKMRHPSRGVEGIEVVFYKTGGSRTYLAEIPWAPGIEDAITQEYEKFYIDYRSRVKECNFLTQDLAPGVMQTEEGALCFLQEVRKKNEYILTLIRDIPRELTALFWGPPSEKEQHVLNLTSDEKLLERIAELTGEYDEEFDRQLGYDTPGVNYKE